MYLQLAPNPTNLYLRDRTTGNVSFIPATFHPMLRFEPDAGGFVILAHVSIGTDPRTTDIGCVFYPVSGFDGHDVLDQPAARAAHPEFFDYLKRLNGE